MKPTAFLTGRLLVAILLVFVGQRWCFQRSDLFRHDRRAPGTNAEPATRRFSTSPYARARQLPLVSAAADELAVPSGANPAFIPNPNANALFASRLPQSVSWSDLFAPDLARFAIPLPEASPLGQLHSNDRRFGRLQTAGGEIQQFNSEMVLVKFRGARHVAALRVEPGQELLAVRALAGRADVEFAELDLFLRQESFPNDPLVTNQWHHQVLGSVQAWDLNRGQSYIRLAIVDAPFQMNHPDLAPHVAAGWDVDQNVAVTNSPGVDHSTLCAGLAAAVINNGLGVAGMGNCTIVPININGAISEMYNAVVWAADHDIRVVNLSWTGGDSDTLNVAGAYLAARARGIMVMAGGNLGAAAYTTNQPNIYCISMTDAADNMQSLPGTQVDFAAPGWNVFSTTSGDGYGFASGTSYAAPVFAGVVAVLLSINPTLEPGDVIAILKTTAYQPNGWPPGWNQYYGWGRIDFAAAAAAAEATRPVITSLVWSNAQARVSAAYRSGVAYSLWRSAALNGNWVPVTNAEITLDGGSLTLTDPLPAGTNGFYRIRIAVP